MLFRSPAEIVRFNMFRNKIEKIQAMSSHFVRFNVYDHFVPSFRGQWAFAIGIGPTKSAVLTGQIGRKAIGKADTDTLFYGTPEEVNLKLRSGLKPGVHPLNFYSGTIQNSFKYPTAGWDDVYCKSNRDTCNALKQKGFLSFKCNGNNSDVLLDDSGNQDILYVSIFLLSSSMIKLLP